MTADQLRPLWNRKLAGDFGKNLWESILTLWPETSKEGIAIHRHWLSVPGIAGGFEAVLRGMTPEQRSTLHAHLLAERLTS